MNDHDLGPIALAEDLALAAHQVALHLSEENLAPESFTVTYRIRTESAIPGRDKT